jgi:hypothetical protein
VALRPTLSSGLPFSGFHESKSLLAMFAVVQQGRCHEEDSLRYRKYKGKCVANIVADRGPSQNDEHGTKLAMARGQPDSKRGIREYRSEDSCYAANCEE